METENFHAAVVVEKIKLVATAVYAAGPAAEPYRPGGLVTVTDFVGNLVLVTNSTSSQQPNFVDSTPHPVDITKEFFR